MKGQRQRPTRTVLAASRIASKSLQVQTLVQTAPANIRSAATLNQFFNSILKSQKIPVLQAYKNVDHRHQKLVNQPKY